MKFLEYFAKGLVIVLLLYTFIPLGVVTAIFLAPIIVAATLHAVISQFPSNDEEFWEMSCMLLGGIGMVFWGMSIFGAPWYANISEALFNLFYGWW